MAKWLIDKAGVQITVNTKSSKAKALIELALKAMQPQRVKISHGIKLSVKRSEDQWLLHDHEDDITRKLSLNGDLIYHLTDRIVFHIANNASAAHCLHAASVAHQGRAIVIPANSGAGKSSFTCWLGANGFDYLTDELILVDAEQNIDGVERPIQIKSHGLDAVKPLIKHSELVQTGRLVTALPIECLSDEYRPLTESPQLALFIFPQYRKGASFSFTKLSSAQAGMSLMSNHVNARNLDGHGFRDMMAIIRNTSCYSLEYGGFDTLPSDFSSQLKALLTSHE